MKKLLIVLLFSIGSYGQNNIFGENIENDQIISKKELISLYDNDVKFNAKFEATVVDVCQMKGCWMRLDLGNNKKVMVNFKDYGFFVPKDITGKNVANPIAAILSLSMALKYSLDLDKEANLLDAAVQKVLDDGLRTKDIMSNGKKEVTTTDMGDAIISKLK